jgi:luciferase family oxidoreductase group 1
MTDLSVLDQSPIRSGGTAADAIRETIHLAQAAEEWGYQRYWVAEHHNSGGLASATPEILIAQLAASTKTIRVGSGGVMLSHYSPLKVAEAFKLLTTLYPGRIDLGIGRAPGTDGRTTRALAYKAPPLDLSYFAGQLMDLWGFLTDSFPEEHEFAKVKASPVGAEVPDLWLLGSSNVSAGYAAELGWGFCHAYFINSESAATAFDAYETLFAESPLQGKPRKSMGVSAIVAESKEEAEYLCWTPWGSRIMGQRGTRNGVPTPEEAMAFDYTPAEREYIEYMKSKALYGTAEEVRDRLEVIGDQYGVDDFVVVTIMHDFAKRLRSYELLAEAFGIVPSG